MQSQSNKSPLKGNNKLEKVQKTPPPAWQSKFPFGFFYGQGKFQPIYFFVTIFCALSAVMLYVKIYGAWKALKTGIVDSELLISTGDITTVLAFVSSLILLYNTNRKNNNGN